MRPMICASDRLNPGLFEGEGAALHLSKKKKIACALLTSRQGVFVVFFPRVFNKLRLIS